MKNTGLKVWAVVAFLVMITANALANILPINNLTTGQLSDFYPNLFTPSAYTFSIWGLIYLLLFIYVIYQFFVKSSYEKLIRKINIYFIISSLANTAWIFAWHYQQIFLSLIIMIVILYSLIKIADILRKEKFDFWKNFIVSVPFSVYFGWISVATIANVVVFLVSIGWNGFGINPGIWTMIVLIVGAIIGILRSLLDRKIAYTLVFIWAYIGILTKHLSSTGFSGTYSIIIYTLYICLFAFVITLGYILVKPSIKKR